MEINDKMVSWFKLVRWKNLLFLAAIMLLLQECVIVPLMYGFGFAPSDLFGGATLVLLITSVILIAAGGYVVNDYFDIKIDRINRPERVIVGESIDKAAAMRLYWSLSAIGIACGLGAALFCRSWYLATLFLLVPGLLWFYSASYKRIFLVGNLIIALTAAMVPMLIALANIGILERRYAMILPYIPLEHDLIGYLSGFAAFAFLTTWIREIIKDLQDQQGDRELECHTMPIQIGETGTKVIVTLLILLTTALMAYCCLVLMPVETSRQSLSTRYLVFGGVIPMACELWLLWAAKIPSDYRSAQLLMKFIMFIGTCYAVVIFRTL